jgi:hypothetical protein
MNKMNISPINEYIHTVSKEIIQEYYPEEISYFNPIWEVMNGIISEMKQTDFEMWGLDESQNDLMTSLGFAEPSRRPDLTTPIIIGVLAASIWHIGTLRDVPKREDVENIIEKYCGRFGATGKTGNILKASLSNSELLSLLKKENIWNAGDRQEEGKVEESKPGAVKKEAYARAWTIGTNDPENGDIISKRKYEDILKEKEKCPLLIIKYDRIRNIFVYGKSERLSPLKYDLLEYILKNKGCGGNLINLLDKVWKDHIKADRLQKEQDNSDHKIDKDVFNIETAPIRKEIVILNQFLSYKLKVRLASHRTGQYRITRDLEYFLLEII